MAMNKAWLIAVEVNAHRQRELTWLRRQHELLRTELAAARECLSLFARLTERHPGLRDRVARVMEERRRTAKG
jgi:hypothetical protein